MGKPTLALEATLTDGSTVTVTGRVAWALRELVRAGDAGCTPITRPAPRWSDYVFRLRHGHGIGVVTNMEEHGGAFPGHHARYVLAAPVTIREVEPPPKARTKTARTVAMGGPLDTEKGEDRPKGSERVHPTAPPASPQGTDGGAHGLL